MDKWASVGIPRTRRASGERPPTRWGLGAAVGLAVLLGVAVGLGAYTFAYAEGHSYLVDDPAACNNCHVMRDQYEGWLRSAHGPVATCNDCHTPEGLVPKYFVKAVNGFNHAWAFTTDRFPEPIEATSMNRRVSQDACRKCHAEIVESISHPAPSPGEDTQETPACTHCHGSVGHPL
jgi:cytochrome c nitrite reductase small subunit